MLSTSKIARIIGNVSNSKTIRLLEKAGIKSERRIGKTGYMIYYDITEEQIKNGILKQADPKEIAIQQATALVALEYLFNRKSNLQDNRL